MRIEDGVQVIGVKLPIGLLGQLDQGLLQSFRKGEQKPLGVFFDLVLVPFSTDALTQCQMDYRRHDG